jgi:hypothetical protein
VLVLVRKVHDAFSCYSGSDRGFLPTHSSNLSFLAPTTPIPSPDYQSHHDSPSDSKIPLAARRASSSGRICSLLCWTRCNLNSMPVDAFRRINEKRTRLAGGELYIHHNLFAARSLRSRICFLRHHSSFALSCPLPRVERFLFDLRRSIVGVCFDHALLFTLCQCLPNRLIDSGLTRGYSCVT